MDKKVNAKDIMIREILREVYNAGYAGGEKADIPFVSQDETISQAEKKIQALFPQKEKPLFTIDSNGKVTRTSLSTVTGRTPSKKPNRSNTPKSISRDSR